jgi:23S rRNA pseudouridine2605 synthase
MQERLQKILAKAGIASRREAETIIASGRVAVNGVTVVAMGVKADADTDVVTLDGRKISLQREKRYILLNKPSGYVTTMKDPEGRPVVTDLVKGVKERVFPVGRLDYNTEGLLLLTNDGDWANHLAHPRHEVDKVYQVRVRGAVSPEQIRRLAEGVDLDDGRSAPAVVVKIRESDRNSWLSITIHEGRYRQVRRMCESVELEVVRLKRVKYGILELGDLKPGQYRELTADEIARLLKPGQAAPVQTSKPELRRKNLPSRTGTKKK